MELKDFIPYIGGQIVYVLLYDMVISTFYLEEEEDIPREFRGRKILRIVPHNDGFGIIY